MDDWEWEKLMGKLSDGLVVPVLGPELLVMHAEGKSRPLYDVWGEMIAEKAGANLVFRPDTPALYQATNHLQSHPGGRIKNTSDLVCLVDSVIQRTPWPIPEPLMKLASIQTLSVFVTTTIDHLLVEALKKSNPAPLTEFSFIPRGDKKRIDFPEGFEPSGGLFCYHLFGNTTRAPKTFASTEDDLIDFSWALLDRQYAPERFFDYLGGKTVLLLGCNFPDWLGRFFVHALNANHQEMDLYYVSQLEEPGFSSFLDRKGFKVLSPCDPLAFVDELHGRWRAAQPAQGEAASASGSASMPVPQAMKRGSVFISYAKEDIVAARAIQAQLESAGVDTWMDKTGLEGGDRWEQVIEDRIRNASFFLAVISKNLDPEVYGYGERFVLREWNLALASNSKRDVNAGFLLPVSVDETPCTAQFATQFRECHWQQLRDGKLDDRFVQSLSEGIRRFRRSTT